MIRPPLSENAFLGSLVRELCVVDGRAIFEEDGPETWGLLDQIEPAKYRLADLRVCLLSEGIDSGLTRAVFEIEGFPPDSPWGGPTQPRVGDILLVELTPNISQSYLVMMTSEWAQDAQVDLGPNELLLALHRLIALVMDE